jgi:hypothetical protein
MSTVLTQTYCAFCEVVANAFEKTVGITESVGRARAASALAQMGYNEEAKQLMLDK